MQIVHTPIQSTISTKTPLAPGRAHRAAVLEDSEHDQNDTHDDLNEDINDCTEHIVLRAVLYSLIVDEIGKVKKHQWSISILCHVLESRVARRNHLTQFTTLFRNLLNCASDNTYVFGYSMDRKRESLSASVTYQLVSY